MYRDKTYVRTANGYLFNVTGYCHPKQRVFASLKYVDGEKWKLGYAAATEYLQQVAPEHLLDGFICVPIEQIVEVFDPQVRWVELQQNAPTPLLEEALQLGAELRVALEVPASTRKYYDTGFGITDSLLWGVGHSESDIDLIVVGRDNARRLLQRRDSIYERDGFTRPSTKEITAPYGIEVDDWPRILDRKKHMGMYHGRPFSVRVVLSQNEVPTEIYMNDGNTRRQSIRFEVADVADSLLFPAIYRDEFGGELVDYSVVYEGVFRLGDVVTAEVEHSVNRLGVNQYTIARDALAAVKF